MRLRRVIGAVSIAVLLVGGAVAANAVSDNGVTATFSPGSPNGSNDFYTSPVDITFEGSSGDTCQPASRTYSGPNGTSASVDSTCTPSDPAGTPYTGTFTFKYDDRAPTVADHADIVRDAGNQSQIDVNYTEPSANDDVDGSPTVTCNPPSGSSFQVGRTTVTCTARDNAGNTSAPSRFTVTVDGAPTLDMPPDRTAEATSSAGAFVNYLVTASDTEDGAVTPDCGQWLRTGDSFPLGTRTVTCTATDSANNTATGSFRVTVEDTTAPTVVDHADIVRDAGRQSSIVVDYTKPNANDAVDGNPAVSCDPPPGSRLNVGRHTVTCTAVDNAGNRSGPSRFVITVDGAPTIDVTPNAPTEEATHPTDTPVNYQVTARDAEDGSWTPTCDRGASGGTFPVGGTPVTCTATDSAGNRSEANFTVTVTDRTPPKFDQPLPSPVWEGNFSGGYQPGSLPAYTKPTANDVAGGVLNVDCGPKAPADFFPLGRTPVTCTATDQRGNQSGPATFPVNVVDTVAPTFIVLPQDIRVQARSVSTGTPASNFCIRRFLTAPTANDDVAGSRAVDPGPVPDVFPMGRTTVEFSSSDGNGNIVRGSATVTVAAGSQECNVDVRAPRNVRKFHARSLDRLVRLTWRRSPARDANHVKIFRSLTTIGARPRLVCRTTGTRCSDRGVRNGRQYRYEAVVYDEADNRSLGTYAFALPHRQLLLRPRDGARVSRPPTFTWVRNTRARYYNFQLYRIVRNARRQVFSAWPTRNRYVLRSAWRYNGRRHRLIAGEYVWYVFPGFGPKSAGNYGRYMGPSNFTKVRRR